MDTEQVAANVYAALRTMLDPELGLDVVELGLVYRLEVDENGQVQVDLTMTTPACPLGEELARQAEENILGVENVTGAAVRLVWDPPWTPARMSDSAREALGW